MMKILVMAVTFSIMGATAFSQSIPKWKMADVVNYYSKPGDTLYVVNFWATFCKPCIAEIPGFIRTVEKYKDRNVKLLLVSLDLPSYYPKRVADFARKNNYNTQIVWLNETNADIFCPMIDQKWSGAIPATVIYNPSTGYKKFFEDELKEEKFEEEILLGLGK